MQYILDVDTKEVYRDMSRILDHMEAKLLGESEYDGVDSYNPGMGYREYIGEMSYLGALCRYKPHWTLTCRIKDMVRKCRNTIRQRNELYKMLEMI